MFSQKRIHFNEWSKIVDWRSFKQRGNNETNYGDIALLVNIQFTSGEILKGVACLEAKRDYSSRNFEMIDNAQLDRILAAVPYSHLLLYCHEAHTLPIKFPNEFTWTSNIWVSPINTSIQLLKQVNTYDNVKVLRTSFPFSMFLSSRIFWGHDLDYRTEIYKDIASGEMKILRPKYVGLVNVYYENQQPIEVRMNDIWEEIEDDQRSDEVS